MALATYTDLQAAVASWCKRTDLTAVIPDFIALAESRIARDLRSRKQIATATLATVANTQTVTLPTDFLEIENITLISSPSVALSVITPEIMDVRFPAAYWTGAPKCYALLGSAILLGPTPDGVYSISLDYYARIAALSVTPTNWLLTSYPMAYLAPALAEAFLYMMDEQRAATWEARYQAEINAVQTTDDDGIYSGSALRARAL